MEEKVGMPLKYKNTLEYARFLDEQDPLKTFRGQFYIPLMHGKDAIYFTGNSLGLQPKTTQDYIISELEDWANYGVEGHFHARNPWLDYHEMFAAPLATLVGAKPGEVVAMNQLTVNLHLLMVSFYRPTKQRYKIICEAKAFPSDQYALETQVKFHGFKYEEAVVEVSPRQGEHNIRQEDILQAIEQHKNELALVLFGGVNYYSGQVFNMQAITEAAHKAGAYAGFDLAHAAGNIELKLHNWGADFACWCSYKYLNSGPGGVSGIFINEKHIGNKDLPRFAGWWGHNKETRFQMQKGFDPISTAEGWQLSNAPVLSMAAHKASLDIFEEAGLDNIFTKNKQLSEYLLYVLEEINNNFSEKIIEIITPKKENEHGCQVSILMLKDGKKIFEELKKQGVIADWREPNVIRVAPVALYNSFEDIFRFGEIIKSVIA
ncbi:MAG: kynureninase [Ferruginibacter sp.]